MMNNVPETASLIGSLSKIAMTFWKMIFFLSSFSNFL